MDSRTTNSQNGKRPHRWWWLGVLFSLLAGLGTFIYKTVDFAYKFDKLRDSKTGLKVLALWGSLEKAVSLCLHWYLIAPLILAVGVAVGIMAHRKWAKKPMTLAEIKKSGWLHSAQDDGHKRAGQYRQTIKIMPALLQMDEFELASRIDPLSCDAIPPRVLRFFLDHPDSIIKEDLWPLICRGLFLADDHFEHGALYNYPPPCGRARLERYDLQGRADVILFLGLNHLSELNNVPESAINRAIFRIESRLLRRVDNGQEAQNAN